MRSFDNINGCASLLSQAGKKLLATTAMTAASFIALSGNAHAQSAPTGAWTNFTDVHGSITTDTSIPDTTQINQHSQTYIGNSNNLDILSHQNVVIGQNNTSSLFVANAVGGSDPTKILGTLKTVLKDAAGAFTTNRGGDVMVNDANGVLFGKDSRVDVGSLIVSTGHIANSDILDGDERFTFSNFGSGRISNQGTITVAEAGVAAFVSPTIVNSGVINARLSNVVMAAGNVVTLDMYGDGLVEVAVDGELADGLISNTGAINAQGGTVQISAAIAKNAVENVINTSGVITVSSAVQKGGKIILSGGESGKVAVNGALNANGVGTQDAGEISVTGENVLIGTPGRLRTNAATGAAGEIKTIATNDLRINGQLSAQGLTGTGFIETSAPTTTFGLPASILATREWLLDPTDIDVDAALGGLIESQLAVGDMTVETPVAGTDAGNITVNTVIDWATDKTFSLIAAANVDINGTGGINATGTGNFEATAGDDINVDGAITTQGGNVTLTAGTTSSQDDINIDAAINTNGGNFTAIAGDDVRIRDDLHTSGGDITLTTLDNPGASEVSITAAASVDSAGGDIHINSDGVRITEVGGVFVNAGAGDININRVSDGTIGLGAAAGDTTITQGELAAISAANLIIGNGFATSINVDGIDTSAGISGATTLNALGAGGTVDFLNTNTFNALNVNAMSGVNIAGAVSTTGGDVNIDSQGTTWTDYLMIEGTGSINSNNGNINLASASGGLIVRGDIDAGAGDINLSGQQVQMVHNSTITGDEVNFDAIRVSQTATSTLIANTITGTSQSDAVFGGTNNDVVSVGDFTTGAGNWHDGGFTLVDNNGVNLIGAVSTTGGDINIDSQGTTWTHRLNIEGTGSLNSNGGNINLASASGGLIIKGNVDSGAGDIDLSGQQVQMVHNSTITGDEVNFDAGRIFQTATSILTANTITGTSQSDAVFGGTNNDVTNIGDFTTGAGNWHDGGFTLVDNNGVNVVGAVSTTGNDIDITTTGDLNVASTGSILTQGGNLTATSTTLVDIDNGATVNLVDGDAHIDAPTVNLGDDITTTGAITGTASIVNVENDDAQIQDGVDVAAINATVNVAAGTYAESVNVYKAGLQLLGANAGVHGSDAARGPESLVTPNSPGFLITANDVVLDGFAIDGADDGVRVSNADRVAVKNNLITNSSDDGIEVNNSNFASVTGNEIDDAEDQGIYIKSSDDVEADNNTIKNAGIWGNLLSGPDNGMHGIFVADSNRTKLRTNTIQNSAQRGIWAVRSTDLKITDNNNIDNSGLQAIATFDVDDVTIRGNTGTNSGGQGIAVVNADKVVIDNNIITTTKHDGIFVAKGSAPSNVANNISITNNKVSHAGDNGIAAKTTTALSISNNEVDDVVNAGILVQNTDDAQIVKNEINDNGATTFAKHGILVEGGNSVDVDDNKVEETTIAGIAANNTTYIDIDRNLVKDGADGIRVEGGHHADIRDNETRDMSDDGIQVISHNDVDVEGNTVIRSNDSGITVSNSQRAKIDDNDINVAKNGIRVTGGSNATISKNEIDDAKNSGILALNNNDVQIVKNEINDNGATTYSNYGIVVEGGNSADVDDNKVEETKTAGIFAKNTTYIDIDRNLVKDGNDGILVEGGHHADIRGNETRDMKDDGIQVVSHNDVEIEGSNIVLRSNDSGITVSNSQRTKIDDNNVDVAKNGIRVTNGSDAVVSNNEIDDASDSAIWVKNNDDAQIIKNEVNDNGATTYSKYGILVEGGNSADVDDNKIEETKTAGIFAKNTTYIDIDRNLVKDGNDGILVEGGHHADIRDNETRDMKDDGIQIRNHNDVDVDGNIVLRADDNGIDLNDSDFANLIKNTVTDSGNNGIDISGGEKANVVKNTVSGSGSNGIDVDDHKGILIKKNTVSDSLNNGIVLEDSKNAKIIKNKVLGTTNIDGIALYGSKNAEVRGNKIKDAGWDGIYFYQSKNGVVSNNVIKRSDVNGISIDSSNGTRVTGNTVKKTYNGNGIKIQDSNRINVDNNIINNVADDGIDVNGGRNIIIDNNFIGTLSGKIGDDSIDIDGARDVTISNNQITAAVDTGIEMKDTDVVNILFNNIYENGNIGVWGRGSRNTNIILSGNNFTDQDIHAQFESGLIDLTGERNTFNGGRIGLRFAPAPIERKYDSVRTLSIEPPPIPLTLVDNDGPNGFGGTIGAQTFDGQSESYVELANGAFFAPGTPTILNALDSTYSNTPFGTFTPSADYANGLPVGVVAYLENKFQHFNDDGSLGLFLFPLLAEVDQEDIFNYFGPYASDLSGLNVTLLGLPGIPGGPVALNNITPAAGGDTENLTPEQLNNIATAAGDEEKTSCWGDALSATGSGPVNFSYGGSAADLLNSEASCGS